MADGPTPQQWAELRSKRPRTEGTLATLPVTVSGRETPIAIAIDQSGYLHLLIPVQCEQSSVKVPDLNGLKVRHRNLETGRFLDLAAHPSHERVFNPVCREIVDAIVIQEREPWGAVSAIIRTWQSAWKPARAEMEKLVQVGLFGELLVLELLMLPCLGPAAVGLWSGPEFERHDFVGDGLHLEVKTTRKGRHEHEISRLDQLWIPAGRQLLLVSVLVEESIAGQETLATRMDSINKLLQDDPSAVDVFMTKMVNMGWSEEMRNSGELLRFNLRDATIHLVDEEFPRLPEDFTPPSGVISVKYTVDLANLPSLGKEEAMALIKNSNPGFVA